LNSLCDNDPYYSGDNIRKNEMGGAFGTYGGREWCIKGFDWRDLRVRGHWVDLSIDGRVILKFIFNKWERGMD
jgi:hypothetical protein